jgi:predicted GTPase
MEMTTLRSELAAALDACWQGRAENDAVRISTESLRGVLHEGLVPRVAVVGRRGVGKSALLNAIAEASLARTGEVVDTTLRARVWHFRGPYGGFVWLDTPGLRAGGRTGRLEDVVSAVHAFVPTALVFCVAAPEVDAAIDGDLDDLTRVMEHSEAPLLALVTRVDELEPPDVTAPPFDDEAKHRHIAEAVATLARHLSARGDRCAEALVLPACTLTAWSNGELTHDARWNLHHVVEYLRALPCADLDPLLRRLGEAIVAHHATCAADLASEGRGRTRELLQANDRAMLDTLDTLLRAWCDLSGPPLRAVHARTLQRAHTLRAAFDLLGAVRASGWAAAARTQALGASVLAGNALKLSARAREALLNASA